MSRLKFLSVLGSKLKDFPSSKVFTSSIQFLIINLKKKIKIYIKNTILFLIFNFFLI